MLRFVLGYLFLLGFVCSVSGQQFFYEDAASYGIDLGGDKNGGFAFGDLNADGYLDLIVNTQENNSSYRSRIYFSDGPPSWSFTDVTTTNATGLNDSHDGSSVMERCVVIADFNHDGYYDFVRNSARRLELYFNKGPAHADGDVPWSFGDSGQQPNFFLWTPSVSDATPPSTAIPYGMNTEGVGAIDYDNDGDLDLFIENHNWGIDIYENTGFASGNFVHVTPNSDGLGLPQSAVDGDYASVTDINDDGYVDGIARKRDQEDFFINNGDGTFSPVGGFNSNAHNSNKGAVALYDFDNDGDYDLVWTESDYNKLWIQNGQGSGTYSTTGEPWASSGLSDPYVVGNHSGIDGLACGDIDNDGDIDMFFGDDSGPSYLFINQLTETGSLSFVRNNMGIDVDEDAEGCSFVDFDQDGDLDLYINIDNDKNQLWINNLNTLPAGGDRLFVEVQEDRDVSGNPFGHPARHAVGANVRLIDCDGNVISGMREVNGGNGHGTQDAQRVHFGLPNGPGAEYVVEVHYPYYLDSRIISTDLVRPSELAASGYVMTVTTTSSASVLNAAPVAVDDHLILCEGQNTIALQVAANDSDADGDTLQVYGVVVNPAHGVAEISDPVSGEVRYTYTGSGTFPGDTFWYRINDRPSCAFIGKFDSARVIINPSPALVLDAGSSECSPDLATYSIEIDMSGGAGMGYEIHHDSYPISDLGSGSFLVENIPADSSLSIWGSDALGCQTEMISLAAVSCPCPTIPIATNPQDSFFCFGSSPSPVKVDDPGVGYSIQWFESPGSTTVLGLGNEFTPSEAGSYYAEVLETISACSSARIPVILEENPELNLTQGDPSCNDLGSHYELELTPGGGTGSGFALSSSDPTTVLTASASSWTISNIASSSLTQVKVLDSRLCESDWITVPDDGAHDCSCANDILITELPGSTYCEDPSSYSISFVVSGGSALPLTVTSTLGVLEDLGSGTYRVHNIPEGSTTWISASDAGICSAGPRELPTSGTLWCNDPPIAVDDYVSTPEDVAVNIDILSNDSDADDPISAASLNIILFPPNGSVVIESDRTFTYTPNANWNGQDSLRYQICDDDLMCDIATVYINVLDINDAPVAIDDFVSGPEDNELDIAVLSNDSDSDGSLNISTLNVISGPDNGNVAVNPDGTISYDPDDNFAGSDSLQYVICDDDGACDTAWVFIQIAEVNDSPLAVDDLLNTLEDVAVSIAVLDNDSDVDGYLVISSLSLTSVPVNGTANVLPDGRIRYTPALNYFGADQFSYQICDDDGACDQADVYITVVSENDPPVALDDYATGSEDIPLNIVVLDNDSDVDGTLDISSLNITTPPANGSLSINADGSITYSPNTDFSGSDAFTYVICDNDGACDTALVNISIGEINDPPVAVDDYVTTDEDVMINIAVLSNDSDPDGILVLGSLSLVASPSHGSVLILSDGTIDYIPGADYFGADNFEYQICDDDANCDQAQVFITIQDVNDPPVAMDDVASGIEDNPVNIIVLSNDSDSDGSLDLSSLTVIDDVDFGSLVQNADGSFSYTPNDDWNGTDQFTYVICDDDGACDTALVQIIIGDVNDPPIAVDDVATTLEDTPIDIDVLANDSDSDGSLVSGSLSIVSSVSNGSLVINPDASITYTPNPGYFGSDVFSYQICDDDGACDQADVTISIGDVNDPPIAVDDLESTLEDVSVVVDILFNDSDSDGWLDVSSVSIIDSPDFGTASVDPITGEIIYNPNSDYFGIDQLTYIVCDNDGACDTAIVQITVADVNDPPIAINDTIFTNEDVTIDFDVLLNDYDIDGSLVDGTLSLVEAPDFGVASINPDFTLNYAPNADFNGSDLMRYRICDDDGACDMAWVFITVWPLSDEPIANDDFITTPEDIPVDIYVLSNDLDPDGDLDSSSLNIIIPPSQGTALTSTDHFVSYGPDLNWFGMDSLQYEICDLAGSCDQAWVYIEVLPVGDPSVAVDDYAIAAEATPVFVPVLLNDWGIEDDIDPATLSIVEMPTQGSATVVGDEIRYVGDAAWFGGDSLLYEICDETGLCDQAQVYFIIHDVQTPVIVAVDDMASTEMGTEIEIAVLANDSDNASASCLELISNPENGEAYLGSEGIVYYRPAMGFTGTDCFNYRVCDPVHEISDEAQVCIEVDAVRLTIPNVFTPNGDGFNEEFEIVGIEQFPNNEIFIYNRWENLVYQTQNYQNTWDGTWDKNGKPLPDGTYFYILYEDRSNDDSPVHKGFIMIRR